MAANDEPLIPDSGSGSQRRNIVGHLARRQTATHADGHAIQIAFQPADVQL